MITSTAGIGALSSLLNFNPAGSSTSKKGSAVSGQTKLAKNGVEIIPIDPESTMTSDILSISSPV